MASVPEEPEEPLLPEPHAASGTSMETAAVSPIAFFQSIFIDLPFLT